MLMLLVSGPHLENQWIKYRGKNVGSGVQMQGLSLALPFDVWIILNKLLIIIASVYSPVK